MTKHRIYTTSVASVYPHYVAKAERKGRTKAEVDEIVRWLTGYSQKELDAHLERRTDFETFFAKAPRPNPARALIKGVVCGVRVEEVAEPTMSPTPRTSRNPSARVSAPRLRAVSSPNANASSHRLALRTMAAPATMKGAEKAR